MLLLCSLLSLKASEGVWSQLHFNKSNRMLMALPMVPVDALAVILNSISPIQIDPVAVLVPPGSLVRQSTVGHGYIIVSVPCGEWPALVVG